MYKRVLTDLVLCTRTHPFQLCRAQAQEERQSAGRLPDKAYLQKILDGWSAGNAANMAQYYDQGQYNFFDIAPLKYSNWAEYQKGVTELLKGYKSLKLTLNDDTQIHTDGNLTWTTTTVKEDAVTAAGKHDMADPEVDFLREAGGQVDDRARAHVRAIAVEGLMRPAGRAPRRGARSLPDPIFSDHALRGYCFHARCSFYSWADRFPLPHC